MSMLAEKKRREKWSLNPRGKAWSEDQNKFGQRLMEKMGWKAGQGLGVDSQGQIDIVKARVKNDSKGLGFKENGEEWLKTTSDFDNLLDKLAGSQEDSGDGSKPETLASLEDRSKNSRARVHYHKYTRGKDISRYSEKDLASIIGPDVIKLKNEQESKSDYTQNQVNKGSLEDYFSKKSKSKDSKSAGNIINVEITDKFKETEMNSKSEFGGLSENSENFKIDSELEVAVSSKKKKRKKTIVDDNVAQVNNSSDSGNYEVEGNQHHEETDVLGKKKKKRKCGCNVENSFQELEENDPNGLNNSVTSESSKKVKKENKNNTETAEHEPTKESSDDCQTHDTTSKKRKRNDEDLSQNVENSDFFDNTNNKVGSNTDEKSLKKKKRKLKGEETVQSEYNNNHTNYNSVIAEPVVNEEIMLKKKKSRGEKNELEEDPVNVQTEYNEECSASNHVVAEETVINNYTSSKKKKKSKDKNKEHLDDPLEVQTDYNEMCTNNNPVVAEEILVNNDLVSKKKKKTKDENKEHKEEAFGEEQTVMKKKHKKEKENSQIDGESTGTSETAPQCEQVVSRSKSGDFLKVLGRRTRLKNIKTIRKTVIDDSYKTEDFMSFYETDNCKKEAAEDENSVPLNTEDEDKKFVYIYRESNPLDCSITKDVLSYENKLVKNKLSKFKMLKKPCIVITDSQNLNKSAVKKLEEVHRVRYYKEFLSEQDISEINAAVQKFRESRTNSEAAASKDVNQNSVITKPKPVRNKIGKKNKTAVKTLGASTKNPKIATGKSFNNNSKLATTKEVAKSVNNEKANYFKCYGEANTDDCNVPKHVVAYEYRLVTTRLKRLEITQPEVKVVIKESNSLNESTRRKLRQIAKIRHLKTLLPPSDLTEVESLVTKFYENLKPKIEVMNAILELEERILEIAGNLEGKPELKLSEEEAVKVKSLLSKKVDAMTDLFQKLETLLESFRKTKDESSTSEDADKENSDAENAGEQGESRFSWLKKVEDKLDTLKKHMKMLAKGKKPPDLNIMREPQTTTKSNKEKSQKFNSYAEKNNYYQNTSYSRGRIAHNVGKQRGRGRGIGRSYSIAKNAVPSGGWGILKTYASGTEAGLAGGSQNYRDGFSDAGRFMGRGRGFSDLGGFSGRGRGLSDRGGFKGRGRGFSDRVGFSGRGRGFMGRGRGDFRGRGRGDRGRGRISQNNFEAKLYAEKCKELNKVPVVCFNGVNMKVISGYPANVNMDKNSASHNDSTCLGNQSIDSGVIAKKESVVAGNTTKKDPCGFSKVVVKKDVQSVDQIRKKRSEKAVMKKEGVPSDSLDKKGTSDAKVT